MGDSDGKKKTVYHYTDARGAKGIQKSGQIKKSTDTTLDAAFGPGVYVTDMRPDKHTKSEIAQNNYDGAASHWKGQQKQGKTDYVVKLSVPASQVQKCSNDRSVYRIPGDVHLNDTNAVIQKNRSDGKTQK
eukprot:GHVU01213887.1.p1 GENE.GHVU01213887.1~~GHVU01213887.1.p1  ORF type:complete len:131 (+),score=23.49 GHVU01213887.1:142-534(+)